MSQSYFPTNVASKTAVPLSRENPVIEVANPDKPLKVEDVQEAYIAHKDRLVNAISATTSILDELRTFNKDDWVVRYPQMRETAPEKPTTDVRSTLRRAMSFADEPSVTHNVEIPSPRKPFNRSSTLASIKSIPEEPTTGSISETAPVSSAPAESNQETLIPVYEGTDFSILRLDLKIGPSGSSTSPASLVSQLEKSSIANLLDERIGASVNHMAKLKQRVEDTSSKVLVTGDLNAGKSTFVNALLRREVMPVDQQPFTSAFAEVHDAAENHGKEEVHVLKDGTTYSVDDESTYSIRPLTDLEDIVGETQQRVRVYLADSRAPSESLLNNGVVDISLIDAPGLNRDSLKTTAVFARQEEIDVVVFVVSAENHFTLSAKEFLWNASNEKAYLFIVVNKFDGIKNKEKCKKLVLEQIKQLSPRTFEDADDLVHFVDSAAALQPYAANPAFDDLESALRSFVLVKRSKSKLQPASTYLSKILFDIDLLAAANAMVASNELDQAKADIERVKPVLEKMKSSRDVLEDSLESVEEDGASSTRSRSKTMLNEAIERVGQGLLAVDRPSVSLPPYPGLLGVWDYARDVRKALLQSLDLAVSLAEDEARLTTSEGVRAVAKLADEHLPEGVERSRRVFMPEAMFSVVRAGKRAGKQSHRRQGQSGIVVAGGAYGVGLGLAQQPELLDTNILDIFDLHHQFMIHFGDGKHSDKEDTPATVLGVFSVGLGALTMVGSQAVSVRGIMEAAVRISDLFSNETARKWAAPVIGAVTVGLTAYFILELPSTIPRTVGRRIRASLVNESDLSEDEMFVGSNSVRISRETRKVLRLASWDLRERFRAAMDERGKDLKLAEELARKSGKAVEFFRGIEVKTGDIRSDAGFVSF